MKKKLSLHFPSVYRQNRLEPTPAIPYYEKILALNPIAYWRMNETSGTTAVCSINELQTGTYARNLTTMGTTASPIAGEVAPSFDGAGNDYLDIYSTTFRDAFELAVEGDGSISLWAKVPLSVWTDSTSRQFFTLRDDTNNYVQMNRHTNDNYLRTVYRAGAVSNTIDVLGQSDTEWVNWIFTWSVTGDYFKVFKNNIQIAETKTGLGEWDGPISSLYTLIGASFKSPVNNPFLGSISNFAVFNKVLSENERDNCANVNISGPYAILLTFDDGYDDHYTEAYTYMESKGLHKATAYIVSGTMNTAGKLTTAQAQTMYAAGWDIANQTQSGADLRPLDQAGVESQLSNCKSYLDTNSMSRASDQVAYPGGYFDDDVDNAMASLGYPTGRCAHSPYNTHFDYDSPPSALRLPVLYVTATQTPNDLKSWAYDAVLYNRVAIFLFHQINDATGYPIASFREFIDWIASRNYTLSTISELYTALYT
jgi:peptidoglycan/xylan/chitin deacetylase (PgdA/CDA1 family)